MNMTKQTNRNVLEILILSISMAHAKQRTSSKQKEKVDEVCSTLSHLFDGNGGPPVLLLVEQREAHGARRIHVWMEQWRLETAFGRRRRVVIFEVHLQVI